MHMRAHFGKVNKVERTHLALLQLGHFVQFLGDFIQGTDIFNQVVQLRTADRHRNMGCREIACMPFSSGTRDLCANAYTGTRDLCANAYTTLTRKFCSRHIIRPTDFVKGRNSPITTSHRQSFATRGALACACYFCSCPWPLLRTLHDAKDAAVVG